MTLIQRNPWSNGVVYHFKVSTVNIQPQSSPLFNVSLLTNFMFIWRLNNISRLKHIYESTTQPTKSIPFLQPSKYHISHTKKTNPNTNSYLSLSLSHYDFIMAKTESGSPCRKKARRWVEPHYTHQFPVPHISRLNERSRDSLNRNNLRPRKYRNVDRIWKQHVSNHQTSLDKSRANTKPRDSKNDPRLVRPEPDTRRR